MKLVLNLDFLLEFVTRVFEDDEFFILRLCLLMEVICSRVVNYSLSFGKHEQVRVFETILSMIE